MTEPGAYVDKAELLQYLEKRLSYFILAAEYELEPNLSEDTRKRLVREYRELMHFVSHQPTHCVMATLGLQRRKPW